MKVTDVKLFKSNKESVVKAFGKATLDNELVLDVLVMDKGDGKGAWATFPNGKTGQDGKYYLPVFFKNKEQDQEFKAKVVEAYGKLGTAQAPAKTPAATGLTQEDMPF